MTDAKHDAKPARGACVDDPRAPIHAARETLFGHVRTDAEMARTFTPERALDDAEVDALETREELPQSVHVTTLPGTPTVILFSGSTPTDAGGIGAGNDWNVAVVQVGCKWTESDLKGNVVKLEGSKTADGASLFEILDVDSQCSQTRQVVRFREAKVEVVSKTTIPREDMIDVCSK